MDKKRGQVTLFIILGILLLLAIVLVAVFREKITIFLPERIVPTQTTPIQRYIEGCADTVARQGLALLGAQGGYIWLPPLVENNPLASIDTGIKIPFWQYYNENRIPSLELMQAQLGRYMNENLRACLDGLDAFRTQYTIVEKGAVATDATATDQLVAFQIYYPLDIMNKEGTKITEITQFRVDVPFKLKSMHAVARSIMETEARDMRLEKIAIDLLALDPAIPLTGAEITCKKKVWAVPEVQQKIKTLLRSNLPLLRAASTDYTPVPSDQPYVQNHYVWKVTDLSYPDIRVAFTFDEHIPFQMAVRPNSGQLLKSSELRGQEVVSFLCLQQWNFVYDLRFPILVTVEDKAQNYALTFGINVNVHNNRADREQLGQPAPLFEQIEATDQDYCHNIYGNYVMKISTFDNVSDPLLGESHDPIDRVNISFTCLKYSCEMGQTRYQQGGAVARLDTLFPYCVNGVLRAKKAGYKENEQFVTTASGKDIPLYLTPIKTMNRYTVVKHLLLGNITTAARPLDPGEKAFISLTYVSNNTVLHRSWGGYPLDDNIPLQPLEFLAEARFPYRLEIYLTDETHGLLGGYTGTWTPDWTALKNGRALEFHVITQQTFVNDIEGLTFMSSLGQLSTKVPQPVVT